MKLVMSIAVAAILSLSVLAARQDPATVTSNGGASGSGTAGNG